MTRKIMVEVFDEDCEDKMPFLKWVTDIVNATPAEHLDALMIRGRGCDWPVIEVTYERDETDDEKQQREAMENLNSIHREQMRIETEKATLRRLRQKYPNG